jgi:AcrR family transcriptional regulator
MAKYGIYSGSRPMPKATFFNLPVEKREHITAVAVEEFGDYDYGDVSISRIVARAGIAKGSFYQYFDDKDDLHRYLLDLIVQKKWEMFSLEHPDPQQIGVFRYLHWMAQAGVQFELAYPDLVRVGYRAASQRATLEKIRAHVRPETMAFYQRLVVKGKEQGAIAPEIDEELAAFIFDAILSGLGQYLQPRLAARQADAAGAFFDEPDVVRIFEQTIDILESGMGPTHVAHGAERAVPATVAQEESI